MTIRYTCDDCGSVLKIKDQLAGTEGKCPKCKKKFTVPEPGQSHAEESGEFESPSEETVISPVSKEASKPAKKPDKAKSAAADHAAQKSAPDQESDAMTATTTVEKPQKPDKKSGKPAKEEAAADNEFDAAAFLMEGNDGPNKATAGLTSEPAEPKKGPAWARGGRRPIASGSGPADDGKELTGAAAAANSQLTASANARDLLSKSMEEGRVRAASMPPEKERRPLIDFSGAKAELRRGLMYVVPAIVGAVLLYLAMSNMLASDVWMPELARVRGRVTLDGKALPNIRVSLVPVNPTVDLGNGKKQTIRTASDVTDPEGYFDIYYMEGVRGAPVGKVRVTLEPVVATPELIKKIPAKYVGNQGPPREVKEAGNDGEFDIDLKTGER